MTSEATDEVGHTIRVVSNRTGLSMDTLRIWERRYGFPAPTRRAGSNRRLYSDEDVARLDAIHDALRRGYRVGDVVHLPLASISALPSAPLTGARTTESRAVERLIDRLKADDLREFELTLRRLSKTHGAASFVRRVADPLTRSMRRDAGSGALSLGQGLVGAESVKTELRALLAGRLDRGGRPHVLVVALPGEVEVEALDLVTLYLAASHATPRLMGPGSPHDVIVAGAAAYGCDVVLVVSTATNEGAAGALRAALPGVTELWIFAHGAPLRDLDAARGASTWQELEALLEGWRARATGAAQRPLVQG